MKIPIAKIGLFLILIIVLPPIFFSAYEVSNLYQNEQMIDSIYTRQLESVLFSINQHSDDIVSGWASDIDEVLKKNDEEKESKINEFIQGHVSLNFVFFVDSAGRIDIFSRHDYGDSLLQFQPRIRNMVTENQPTIRRLLQYMKSNYRKIQPIDITVTDQSLFLFATKHAEDEHKICGLVVNTEKFLTENLGPKIQSVAQNTFFISVFNRSNDQEVYSNDLTGEEEKNIEHKKVLWLFPDYELGIELRGETIEDLVRQRTYYNLLIMVILDLVLLLAAWFVYRAVRQQVRLAQLKSDFVANVSHEIRTPLAIINMYSETLEMDRIKSEEKKKEYYKVINTETNRLSGIVNKILSFSKIDSGKKEYRFVETDLNEVVEQIISNYQHHFKNKGFDCIFIPAKELQKINGDKEAITDAVINLIDNAVKYSDEKKQIEVVTGNDRGNVTVEVKDYGIGIDEKEQKLVFDKFYRVTRGDLAYKAKGSGIGLSIVKHIMDAHGGSAELVSKPGEGSRFILRFPARNA